MQALRQWPTLAVPSASIRVYCLPNQDKQSEQRRTGAPSKAGSTKARAHRARSTQQKQENRQNKWGNVQRQGCVVRLSGTYRRLFLIKSLALEKEWQRQARTRSDAMVSSAAERRACMLSISLLRGAGCSWSACNAASASRTRCWLAASSCIPALGYRLRFVVNLTGKRSTQKRLP